MEVLTPPAVKNPGIEAHLHPISLRSKKDQKDYSYYLNTSPEFEMKKLLAAGMKKIYQLAYSFRDEPQSKHHRFQFLMLEWYRANCHYDEIKKDVVNLIQFLSPQKIEPSYKTVNQLFLEYLNIPVLDMSRDELDSWIKKNKESLYRQNLDYNDLFFLLFLNEIEPKLANIDFLILDQYPASMSALATVKENYCERFEVYLKGIEVANCFNELTNLEEQKKRITLESQMKENLYHYSLPYPNTLVHALEKGLPPSAGIALGVERLYGALYETEAYFLFNESEDN